MLIRHKDTGHELEVPDETNLDFFPEYEKATRTPRKAAAPRKRTARKSTARKAAPAAPSGDPTE